MARTVKISGSIVAPRRDLCLEFVNTLAWRGSAREESLHGFTDLARWCAANGMLAGDGADRAARWAEKNADEARVVFGESIALREALYRIFFAAAEHRPPGDGDIGLVNRALAGAPARRILAHRDRGFGWRIEREGFSAPALLGPVLWSAGDLIVGPDAARLRHCANDRCLWLFLDDSKNGSRRWCSMQSCGNRAKAHRHYVRMKSA